MRETSCPHCGKSLETLPEVAFCPFCGGALAYAQSQSQQEPREVFALIDQAEAERDPRKRYAMLTAAEEKYPQSLGVAQSLLFLGRLHERGGKNVDFSIIKCYLFMPYLEPEKFSEQEKDKFREELFVHPQLEKCLALCEDKEAFLRMYLLRLEGEFVQLFLRGDSRYMRRIFGFGMDGRAAKLLASPVAIMLSNIRKDDKLSEAHREMLMRTLYQAFSKDVAGETQWLDTRLKEEGIAVSGIC